MSLIEKELKKLTHINHEFITLLQNILAKGSKSFIDELFKKGYGAWITTSFTLNESQLEWFNRTFNNVYDFHSTNKSEVESTKIKKVYRVFHPENEPWIMAIVETSLKNIIDKELKSAVIEVTFKFEEHTNV